MLADSRHRNGAFRSRKISTAHDRRVAYATHQRRHAPAGRCTGREVTVTVQRNGADCASPMMVDCFLPRRIEVPKCFEPLAHLATFITLCNLTHGLAVRLVCLVA